MIEKAMKALAEKDYLAFAACFSEDCKYFDYCPSSNGEDNYVIYGNDCMEMFFRNRFTFNHLSVFDPVVESRNTANFFGSYDGPYIFARFRIEEFDADGLIRKTVVHPS